MPGMTRQGSSPELDGTTPEVARLLVALDLIEAGIELTWWRLRREHPEASDAEIDALRDRWLRAPRGDAGRAANHRLPVDPA